MVAVVRTSGRQYMVAPDDVIKVDRLDGEPGAIIEFKEVLMVKNGADQVIIGTPLVEGASVTATILRQSRDAKIIVFKMKRRKGYRRKHGHRQDVTHLRIKAIHQA